MVEAKDLSEHPLISLYEKTEKESFPLILVIGRRANDDLPMNGEIGHYDLKDVRNAKLRSLAYRVVARSKGTSVKFLMELCRLKRSSILVFADITPSAIHDKTTRENQTGDRFRPEEYAKHAEKVLSTSLFERAAMLIISGLGHERYKKAVRALIAKSRDGGKIVIASPQPSETKGTRWADVRRGFSQRDFDYAAAIFDRWMMNSTFQYLDSYTRNRNFRLKRAS